MFNRRSLLSRAALLGAGSLVTPSFGAVGTTVEGLVNRKIQELRALGQIASDERTSWVVTDINRGQKLVSINEPVAMQCASMVKHMVIQAYLMCHFTKDAKLYPLSPRVMNEMRDMIVHSNNEFTNHIIKRLGGPEGVQWMLKKEAPNVFRDIHIVEYIPENGRTYLNRASGGDYDRFLLALWHNQLPGAEILKKMMVIPNHDRIRSNTRFVTENAATTVYDKTGSTAMLCGNTGIIECKDRNGNSVAYTFTGIIEKKRRAANYSSWISDRSDVMRSISDLVYLDFAQRYPLT
ncbi:class A beta-lactamase-related serine hydrolase [Suttonella sp. R2A3]|uniref:serine hydrolase n=1 Tax=Suttonella sp. R2A3 TaxID=2908648 RepID=UPI001F31ECB8|nr:serine hydrolase [Suttonella sp. R2A3]UJF24086.1 class A beta-lactamase-related serine hydrolase [Suttonella sp. R2A3]